MLNEYAPHARCNGNFIQYLLIFCTLTHALKLYFISGNMCAYAVFELVYFRNFWNACRRNMNQRVNWVRLKNHFTVCVLDCMFSFSFSTLAFWYGDDVAALVSTQTSDF
jgi:hypothetical protein